MMNNEQIHQEEKDFMSLALSEAKQAFKAGDFPIGAVLTINGKLLDKARNTLFTDESWTAHAEHNLIYRNSAHLLHEYRNGHPYDLNLYTTLEPCLMCLGIAIMHRISKIIIACPDPHGGATNADPQRLGIFYPQVWPVIQMGPYKVESYELIIAFLKTEKFSNWQTKLKAFRMMRRRWGNY